MKIIVTAGSEESEKAFLKRHAFAAESIVVRRNEKSLFDVINSIIEGESEPVLLVHDDIYFNSDFEDRVEELLQKVSDEDYEWGVIGNAGIANNAYGYRASNIIRYVVDPHEGATLSARILPVRMIDGNTMLINAPELRKRNVRLPSLSGFQLYDLALSIESLKAGLGVFVSPELLCYHDNKDNPASFISFAESDEAQRYLGANLKNTYLETLNGIIKVREPSGDFDWVEATARIGRKQSGIHVAIVVRTQFKRPEQLFRTLTSIRSFIASSQDADLFQCHVVTDVNTGKEKEMYGFPIHYFPCDLRDSRFLLVSEAIKNILSDYIWFVDDDDWLFPNSAEWLANTIRSAPSASTFFIGTEHFIEKKLPGSESLIQTRAVTHQYFPPSDLFKSIYTNHIPFSGIIFPRLKIIGRWSSSEVEKITMFEDWYLQILNFQSDNFFPITINKLFVGISIRGIGQTVTLKDRTEWYKSESTIYYDLVKKGGMIFSIPRMQTIANGSSPSLSIDERKALKSFYKAKLLKYKILSFLTFGGPRGRYKERKRKYREKFRKL